ncbi:selenide, water dikinase SelD [Marinobacteraceae bacterium S3BR75-40.1]
MTVRLTQYSHGAGCGCKIAPDILDRIVRSQQQIADFPGLLVGNSSSDDAAVHDIGNGQAVISTTDFFMPIVDDPFDFGRIAATNAISDVYAMGGRPLMAIAILGWPVDKLAPEIAGEVLDGGRAVCQEAGIPLAGGHSIDAPEPIFGLAVTGLVNRDQIKYNDRAQAGDLLYLTKPLGVGILTTAGKRDLIDAAGLEPALKAMTTLNRIGADLAALDGLHALTDVTGFGLLGHLLEVCRGSDLDAKLRFSDIPRLPGVDALIAQGVAPGGTHRNFSAYGQGLESLSEAQKLLLCDPQTSGGLLAAVAPDSQAAFEATCRETGLDLRPIGSLQARSGERPSIEVG